MAGLGFMGGLGAAGNGFMEGMNQAEDRKAQLEERAYLKGQRQRKLDEQAREDKLRKDIQGVATTEDVQVPDDSVQAPASVANENGVTVTPVPTPGQDSASGVGDKTISTEPPAPPAMKTVTRDRQQDAIWRDYAKAYQAQGDIAKAAEFNEKADKYAFQRTGRQVNEVLTGGGDLFTKAQRAADLFDKDPFGGGVKGAPIKNEDGSVTLNLYNKENPGKVFPKTFKNERELAESLQSHYSPEMYAKIQDARIKAQENAMDPSKRYMRVGNSVYDTATQTFQSGPVPPGFVYDGEGADGQPRFVRGGSGGVAGTGSGAGAGAGKGKGAAAVDPVAAALANFDKSAEHSENKLTIEQHKDGRAYTARLAKENPGLPAEMASQIGIAIALKPESVVPDIDLQTGRISNVYKDPISGDTFKIRGDVGDALNIPKGADGKPLLTPEQMRDGAQKLIKAQDKAIPGTGNLYKAAAADPSGKARTTLENTIRSRMEQEMSAQSGWDRLSQDQRTELVNKGMSIEAPNIQSRLDLIKNFGTSVNGQEKTASKDAPKVEPSAREKAAAKKYGTDLDAPSVYSRLGASAKGLYNYVGDKMSPSDAFVDSAQQKMQNLGRIEQSDAMALAQAFRNKPELKAKFDQEQLDAIKAISGQSF